jgi:subtilisin family serine protease
MTRLFFRVVAAAMGLSLGIAPALVSGGLADSLPSEAEKRFVPNEILVKFKPQATNHEIESLHARHGSRELRIFSKIGVHHLKIALPVEEALRVYRNSPLVEYAEPNYIQYPVETVQLTPNDPRYPKMWGLHNTGQTGGTPDADIDAPEAWDLQTGSLDIIVAVIDTGRYDHVDLVGNRWTNPGEIPNNGLDDDGNGYTDDVHGWNFFGRNNVLFGSDACDDAHGTHTSGTVGAVGNNATGVVGVNWNVSIMTLKFLGGPGCSGYTSDAIEAILYAASNGAHLSSNSWGAYFFSQALKDAIEAAEMPFVAAAGNDNLNNDITPLYPASYTSANIISVAFTTHTDAKSSFSNYGAISVDLGAPGSSILSTVPYNNYKRYSGTSMATPHVAGVVALLYAEFPGITPTEAKCRVLSGVDPIPSMAGKTVTGGRLNAYGALITPCGIAVVDIAGHLAVGGLASAGNPVKLRQPSIGTIASTTTDVNGDYQFDPVASGTYSIVIKNVGVSGPKIVSGGLQVQGFPSVGNPVKLRNVATGVTVGTTTDASGNYSFGEVASGIYQITIKNVVIP